MTAVSLFDLMAREGEGSASSPNAERLARFAGELVQSLLVELDRIRDYEQLAAVPDRVAPEIEQAVWRLYDQWAADADQTLARVRIIDGRGGRVADADRLLDALGRVRARLAVTPERLAAARAQVQSGQVRPASDLRHELQDRLRP
jgi:hypothetical protein